MRFPQGHKRIKLAQHAENPNARGGPLTKQDIHFFLCNSIDFKAEKEYSVPLIQQALASRRVLPSWCPNKASNPGLVPGIRRGLFRGPRP
jgi:hypothetical protein